MPLYEVVLNQRCFQQQCINRWNYVMTGTPAAVTGSFALLSAMGFISNIVTFEDGTIARELQQLQSESAEFIDVSARAIYIDDDFYGTPFVDGTAGVNGTLATSLSPTDAFGFRSSRVKQSIRRGTKRFVGVDENHVTNGGQFSSGVTGQMEVLAGVMSDALSYTDEGNSLTFTPCVVQKEKYTTPSGKDAYRYYATEVAQAAHLAQGIAWEIYQETRTQVSRQYRRGS